MVAGSQSPPERPTARLRYFPLLARGTCIISYVSLYCGEQEVGLAASEVVSVGDLLPKAHSVEVQDLQAYRCRLEEALQDMPSCAPTKGWTASTLSKRPFGPWFMKVVVNDALKSAARRERTFPIEEDDAPTSWLANGA
jgi:hypothetical protein